MIFSCFEDGNTSAHIAAKRGSSRVLQELLKFDKNIVTTSRLLFWHFIQVGSPSPFTITITITTTITICRNRITDSTPLHVATEGGHTDVVKLLISCGASPLDENKVNFWGEFSKIKDW